MANAVESVLTERRAQFVYDAAIMARAQGLHDVAEVTMRYRLWPETVGTIQYDGSVIFTAKLPKNKGCDLRFTAREISQAKTNAMVVNLLSDRIEDAERAMIEAGAMKPWHERTRP